MDLNWWSFEHEFSNSVFVVGSRRTLRFRQENTDVSFKLNINLNTQLPSLVVPSTVTELDVNYIVLIGWCRVIAYISLQPDLTRHEGNKKRCVAKFDFFKSSLSPLARSIVPFTQTNEGMSSPPGGDFASTSTGYGHVSSFGGSPFIEEDNPFADLVPSRNAPPVSVIQDPTMTSLRIYAYWSGLTIFFSIHFWSIWIIVTILLPPVKSSCDATETLNRNLHSPDEEYKSCFSNHISSTASWLPSRSIGRCIKNGRLRFRIGSPRPSWRNGTWNRRTSSTTCKRWFPCDSISKTTCYYILRD